MSTDERPESLASQAASWVPPWERRQTPDPAYAAAAGPIDMTDPGAADPGAADPGAADPGAADPGAADPDVADPDAADPDEIDPGAADPDEPEADEPDRDDVPPELPPIPGEADGPVTVDAPQILPDEGEPAPTDVGVAPDVPVPGALETAEDADPDHAERGSPVDAPAPSGGDDAGDVFDAAADDDLAAEPSDLPVTEDSVEPDFTGPGAVVPGAVGPDSVESDSAGPGAVEKDSVGPGAAGPEMFEAGESGSPGSARGSGDAGPAAVAGRRRTPRKEQVADVLPAIDEAELRAALEAILLVVDEPVGELQLAQIMEQPAERVASVLEQISAAYTAAGNGFDLRRAAGGWRLYTRPEYAPYVERFVLDGQSVRLTQAALETLAVIAYKQPVTRSRISVIRGVNCDGVMRTLVTRGLIEECGVETETGAFLYRTTVLFLEKLGLDSVDQLPPLAPFLPDDVEEVLDAQR